MQVILQRDVKNLGQAGQIVSVKPGYARNLLLPKGWALPFTKGSAAEAEHRKVVIASKQKKALGHRKVVADKLKGTKLSFTKEADTAGHLFGSLTVFEISKELQAKGFEVDKKVIQVEQPFKQTGEYQVVLDFGSDISVEIQINIEASVSKHTIEMDKIKKEAEEQAKALKKAEASKEAKAKTETEVEAESSEEAKTEVIETKAESSEEASEEAKTEIIAATKEVASEE